MTDCIEFCTKAECEELKQRINYLEQLLSNHLTKEIPDAHKIDSNIRLTNTYQNGILRLFLTIDYLGDAYTEVNIVEGLNIEVAELADIEECCKKIDEIHSWLGCPTSGTEYKEKDYEKKLKDTFELIWSEDWTPIKGDAVTFPQVLERFLSIIYHRAGYQDLPAEVPEWLTVQDEKNLKHQTMTRFNSWAVQQLDALLGQYPIKIKLEDSDLIKVGSQGLELEFPNVAETLAEMTGQILQAKASTDAILALVIRIIGEVGSTKITTIHNNAIVESISEYLGYSVRKKAIKVPMMFNPVDVAGEDAVNSISKLIEPKEIDLAIEEMAEKNTLSENLAILLESARIIKAVHFKTLDKNNLEGNLKDIIKTLANNFGNNEEKLNQDVDDIIDKVEQGFINEPGITDVVKPYGRDYSQRPKIKKLGNLGD